MSVGIGDKMLQSRAEIMFAPRTDSLLQRACTACAARRGPPLRQIVRAAAPPQKRSKKPGRFGGLGDLLGPIGLTLGSKLTVRT